jgi:hypothetical protein
VFLKNANSIDLLGLSSATFGKDMATSASDAGNIFVPITGTGTLIILDEAVITPSLTSTGSSAAGVIKLYVSR